MKKIKNRQLLHITWHPPLSHLIDLSPPPQCYGRSLELGYHIYILHLGGLFARCITQHTQTHHTVYHVWILASFFFTLTPFHGSFLQMTTRRPVPIKGQKSRLKKSHPSLARDSKEGSSRKKPRPDSQLFIKVPDWKANECAPPHIINAYSLHTHLSCALCNSQNLLIDAL